MKFWPLVVAFALGALLGAGIVNKNSGSKLRALRADIEQATNQNNALKADLAAAVSEKKEAQALAAREAEPVQNTAARTDNAMVAVAMQAVRERLKDPASAVFGDIRVVPGKTGQIACGTVNARNSFGGFTGMQTFSVDFDRLNAGDATAVQVESGADWLLYCSGLVQAP